jgi:membrane protein DedA with SNARE-associated domain
MRVMTEPTAETVEQHRPFLTDAQALGAIGAWVVFRQITSRIGLTLVKSRSVRVGKPFLIPLMTNSFPQLIVAGDGASGHWLKFAATMAASVVMSTITGLIFYWAGDRFGHRLAEMSKRPGSPWASIWNPKQIARAERWMDRWGIIVVFLGRATEHFTLPITLVAGASEMRFRRFIAAHVAGAVAFAGLFLWVGTLAKTRFPWLDHWITHVYVKWAFWVGIASLVLLAVVFVIGRFVPNSDNATTQSGSVEPPTTA